MDRVRSRSYHVKRIINPQQELAGVCEAAVLTPEEITQSCQIIAARLGEALQAVYLFGSQVTGLDRVGSDVDLALLCTSPLTADVAYALKTDLAYHLKRDIDLLDLRRADTVTRAQVVTTGDVILVRDANVLGHFETYCLSAYALLNEERAGILADTLAKGTVYG